MFDIKTAPNEKQRHKMKKKRQEEQKSKRSLEETFVELKICTVLKNLSSVISKLASGIYISKNKNKSFENMVSNHKMYNGNRGLQ